MERFSFSKWCDNHVALYVTLQLLVLVLAIVLMVVLTPIEYTPVPEVNEVLSSGPISTMQIVNL